MSEPNPHPGDVSGSVQPTPAPEVSTGSVPTASVPVAAPPAYPPAGYPTSETAPVAYPPVSAIPVSYGAYPAPVATAPPRKRSAAAIVFGILTVVFVLVAGGLAAVYFVSKHDSDQKIADQQSQIATLQSQVTDKTKQVNDAQGELRNTKDDLAKAKQEAAASAGCAKAAQDFFDASKRVATEGQSAVAEANAVALRLVTACNVKLI